VSKYVDTHLAGIDTELGVILGLIGGGSSGWNTGADSPVPSGTTNIDWTVYNAFKVTLPSLHFTQPTITIAFTAPPALPSMLVLELFQPTHLIGWRETNLAGSTLPSLQISGGGIIPASLNQSETLVLTLWWDGTNYNVTSINSSAQYPYGAPTFSTFNAGPGLVSDPGTDGFILTSHGWDVPAFDASAIISGVFSTARIPSLDASIITTGVIATARLGSGTAAANSYLAGDQTYKSALVPASVAATGTVTGSNISGSTSGTNTGDVTLAAVGSTPNANAATLSGQVLNLQPANGTTPGVLTALAQTIGGVKTFTSNPIITGSQPLLDITDTHSGGKHWQLRSGLAGVDVLDFYSVNNSKTLISFQADGNVNIGAGSNPANNSRLYVFGGANGANIDVRGDAAVQDQAVIELEGSDYDTNFNSVRVQNYGVANVFGNTMGYTNTNLQGLMFQGVDTVTAMVVALGNFDIHFGTNFKEWMDLTKLGNLGIHTTSPTANFQVNQATYGPGTVSNGAGGTTVTGVGTQFTNTFKIGDTITIGSETKAISAIASDTSMTTASFTSAHSGLSYTLVGGTRFQVFGNGAATMAGTFTAGNFSGTSSGTNTGDVTLTAVGSSPSANGATLSGQALTLQPADGTHPGLLTSGAQTIGGAKTFSAAISASNLSGTNTGDQTITLTSDVTGSGTGSFATTISAAAVTLAKMANLAANSIIGNNTGSAATPIALTTTQTKALLAIANTDVSGLGTMSTQNSNAVSISGGTITTTGLASETFSTAAAVSAAGSTQGTATAITNDFNVITTVASSTGVVLPTATVGRRMVVVNKGANPLAVYPASGASIDALSANAAVTIPVAGWVEFDASSTTQWYSTFNAISTSALTGDVTASGTTNTMATTIAAGAVTLTKMANLAANSIIGNNTGSPATPIALTVAQTLTLLGITSGASVSSVAMTVPSIMSVSGSPITTSGTLAVTLATQSQNLFFTGPASGSAATPTFRAIVPLDLGTGSATANNVLLGNQTWGTVPNAGLTNSSLTIGTTAISLGTTAATLTAFGADQETFSTAATVSAAGSTQGTATAITKDFNVATTVAASTGVVLPTATVGRRIIVINKGANALAVYPASGAAIDALSANASVSVPVGGWIEFNASTTTQWYSTLNAMSTSALTGDVTASGTTNTMATTIASGVVTLAKMANLAANSFIGNNTGSPATPIALTVAQSLTLLGVTSGASVSSVAMTVPSILSVSGSPITTSGTLAVTLATQTQNLVFTGPASGSAATPTFRALVALDLGTGTANSGVFFRGDMTWTNQLAGNLILTAGNSALIGNTTATTLNSIAPTLQVVGTTNAKASGIFGQWTADAVGSTIQFSKSRGTSIGTTTATASGDVVGKLDFWAANANGTSAMANAGYYQVVVDGTPGTTFSPGRHEWYTATAAAGPAVKMTLTNGGLLGIGNTPQCTLDVSGFIRPVSTAVVAPTGGKGLELYYDSAGDTGGVLAYDRTGGAYKPLSLRALNFTFDVNGTNAMVVTLPIAGVGQFRAGSGILAWGSNLGTTAANYNIGGQGSYTGWNVTGGNGETDFINHRGGGGGGFYFYNTDGSTSVTAIAKIIGNGTALGQFLGANYGSTEIAKGTITSTVTLDFTAGMYQSFTLTASTAYTVTFTAPTNPCMIYVKVTAPSGTVPAGTWPTVKGTALASPITSSKANFYGLFYDGTNYWNISSVLNQ
jgi:hypothetical protein